MRPIFHSLIRLLLFYVATRSRVTTFALPVVQLNKRFIGRSLGKVQQPTTTFMFKNNHHHAVVQNPNLYGVSDIGLDIAKLIMNALKASKHPWILLVFTWWKTVPLVFRSFVSSVYPGDLFLFALFQLSHKKTLRLAHKLQIVVWRVLSMGQVLSFSKSILGFLEERAALLSKVMGCSYVVKLTCMILSKLGFHMRADLPILLSKVMYALYIANFIDLFKTKFLHMFLPNLSENRRQSYVVNRSTSVVIWVVGILVACEMVSTFLRVPLSSTLAFGGVGGLAIGLSARDIAANFLGGMLLLFNEPFTPGDMVTFRTGNTELIGRVERVGWGQTRIRGRDTRPTYIPNSHFVQTAVTNMERITHRKFEIILQLRYQDGGVMNDIISRIREGIRTIPKLDILSMPFRVNFVKIGTYGLEIEITCYFATKSIDEFLALQQMTNQEILKAISASGGALALPTSQIYHNQMQFPQQQQQQPQLQQQQIMAQLQQQQQQTMLQQQIQFPQQQAIAQQQAFHQQQYQQQQQMQIQQQQAQQLAQQQLFQQQQQQISLLQQAQLQQSRAASAATSSTTSSTPPPPSTPSPLPQSPSSTAINAPTAAAAVSTPVSVPLPVPGVMSVTVQQGNKLQSPSSVSPSVGTTAPSVSSSMASQLPPSPPLPVPLSVSFSTASTTSESYSQPQSIKVENAVAPSALTGVPGAGSRTRSTSGTSISQPLPLSPLTSSTSVNANVNSNVNNGMANMGMSGSANMGFSGTSGNGGVSVSASGGVGPYGTSAVPDSGSAEGGEIYTLHPTMSQQVKQPSIDRTPSIKQSSPISTSTSTSASQQTQSPQPYSSIDALASTNAANSDKPPPSPLPSPSPFPDPSQMLDGPGNLYPDMTQSLSLSSVLKGTGILSQAAKDRLLGVSGENASGGEKGNEKDKEREGGFSVDNMSIRVAPVTSLPSTSSTSSSLPPLSNSISTSIPSPLSVPLSPIFTPITTPLATPVSVSASALGSTAVYNDATAPTTTSSVKNTLISNTNPVSLQSPVPPQSPSTTSTTASLSSTPQPIPAAVSTTALLWKSLQDVGPAVFVSSPLPTFSSSASSSPSTSIPSTVSMQSYPLSPSLDISKVPPSSSSSSVTAIRQDDSIDRMRSLDNTQLPSNRPLNTNTNINGFSGNQMPTQGQGQTQGWGDLKKKKSLDNMQGGDYDATYTRTPSPSFPSLSLSLSQSLSPSLDSPLSSLRSTTSSPPSSSSSSSSTPSSTSSSSLSTAPSSPLTEPTASSKLPPSPPANPATPSPSAPFKDRERERERTDESRRGGAKKYSIDDVEDLDNLWLEIDTTFGEW